jgi:hypothetical protein
MRLETCACLGGVGKSRFGEDAGRLKLEMPINSGPESD